MGAKFDRYFVPAVIGFAPFVLLLLTWGPDGRSVLQRLTLGFYLPMVVMELFVIVVGVREGLVAAMKHWAWPRFPTAALFVLVAIAMVTAITAPNPSMARIWTVFWLIHLLFGFSIAHLCMVSLGRGDLVVAYLAGFVSFAAGAILFSTQVTHPNFDWTHGWPAATHIRHYGYYATAVIGLCIGLTAAERRPPTLAVYFFFCTGSFAFALWTGSRGTVLGIAGALIAGLILIPAVRRAVVWAGAALSLALGGLLASLFPGHGPFGGFERTITQTVESGDVSTGRTQLWLNVIDAIRERPIFGYGESQMSTVAPFGTLGQAHNVILQILLAWGVFGLICVAVLAVWFLSRSWRVVRSGEPDLLPPVMAMLALASMAMFDGALIHVLPVTMFVACGGMIASRWTPMQRNPH